ncbi:MAG: mandelate racemase/muconate lactonizing enzyme family protein, partial [Saprospiraceae bacterium]|nr:mandelate racemase/muconate lactonizing enzyme family protein [Saprospiraceae bacterium]
DIHGQHHKCTALKISTDQGAVGWGLSSQEVKNSLDYLLDKNLADLISPDTGALPPVDRHMDFALYDLMGVILNKPVYELLGNHGPRENPIYSGMIYLDELEPPENPAGLDVILKNCEWDYQYGYRQLKVKIGRGGKWYPHDAGLDKDIEVIKMIYEEFKNRQVDILLDANDIYTLEDTIALFDGIGDIPIFWIEEPFREEASDMRELKKWMRENGFTKTLYVDGEANPDHALCLEMASEGTMDGFLPDIHGYGFTKWLELMPILKRTRTVASPHAWGNMLKTHYIAHLAAGLGNVVTIEGVTCLSDDIDYGDYAIKDGKIRVSDDAGFGMKLLV